MKPMAFNALMGTIFLVIPLVALIGLVWAANAWTCSARWSGTYETDYGLMSGCRVLVDGKMFPEDRVREVGG